MFYVHRLELRGGGRGTEARCGHSDSEEEPTVTCRV